MQAVLNLGKQEVPKLKSFLKSLESLEKKSQHEEARAGALGCVLTLYKSGKLLIQGNNSEKVKKMLLKEMNLGEEIVLGIDETGRGENFGPLVVAGVLGDKNRLLELRDSKKVRNIGEKQAIACRNSLAQASVSFNAEFIDRLRAKGKNLNEIEAIAINKLAELFEELGEKHAVKVDGSPLKGAKKGMQFIVRGDDLEPVIGAASVYAKYLRESSADKKERKSWKKA